MRWVSKSGIFFIKAVNIWQWCAEKKSRCPAWGGVCPSNQWIRVLWLLNNNFLYCTRKRCITFWRKTKNLFSYERIRLSPQLHLYWSCHACRRVVPFTASSDDKTNLFITDFDTPTAQKRHCMSCKTTSGYQTMQKVDVKILVFFVGPWSNYLEIETGQIQQTPPS